MTVVNLAAVREKKYEELMVSETKRFILDFVLPNTKPAQKKELLEAFQTQNVEKLIEMIKPYMMRYKMMLDNKPV